MWHSSLQLALIAVADIYNVLKWWQCARKPHTILLELGFKISSKDGDGEIIYGAWHAHARDYLAGVQPDKARNSHGLRG